MKLKNIIKIITLNISFLILAVVLLEIYSHYEVQKTYATIIEAQNKINKRLGEPKIKLGYKLLHKFNYSKFEKEMRPPTYTKSKKRPLIFFGCSYTYGWGLNQNQLLPTKVAKLSNRTTYNRGVAASGTQHIYYQLSNKDFYKEIPDAEYIIYTFIYDHINRLHKYQLTFFGKEINLRYKIKNGKLQEIQPVFSPFYSLYTVKRIQADIEQNKLENKNESFNLFLTILKESMKQAKMHYPNVKFVILLYKDPWNSNLTTSQINLIKKEGFIVIDAEDLVGHELRSKKYRLEDDDHPSEQAWNEIAPKLVKKLNL